MATDTCFIYVRISQDRSAEELGVQRQEEICRAHAEQQGLTVTEVFRDNDVSAYSGKPRPAYESMLTRLRAREVQTVLVYKVDRLYRRVADLLAYINACGVEGGVRTIAVEGGGVIDLSTATGRLNAGIQAQFAEYESGQKSDRLKAKWAQLARSGGYHGGPIPFGWVIETDTHGNKVHRHDPEKAKAVEQAALDVLAGTSIGTIMRRWNDKGWRGSNGAPFSQSSVRNILKRPANAGLAVHRKEPLEGVAGPWPALMSEELWRGVRALLSDPTRKMNPTNKPIHPLSGIAQCWCSGMLYPTSVRARGVLKEMYRCRGVGPGHVSIMRAELNLIALRKAASLYAYIQKDSARLQVNEGVAKERASLEAEISALSARLDELTREYVDGSVSTSMFSRTSAALEGSLESKRTRLAELATATPAPTGDPAPAPEDSDVYKEFMALPLDDVRAFLRQYVNVVVWPGWRNKRLHPEHRVVVATRRSTAGPGPLLPGAIALLRPEQRWNSGAGADLVEQ